MTEFVSPKSTIQKKLTISTVGLKMLIKAYKGHFESIRDDLKILMTFGIDQITLKGQGDKVDEAFKKSEKLVDILKNHYMGRFIDNP